MRGDINNLLDWGVDFAEYHGGRNDGQIISIREVDFERYLWSGIIIGDRAIFIQFDYMTRKEEAEKSEVEISEEARYYSTQEMLEGWFSRKKYLRW